jgi:hypothetical protein
MNNEIYKSKYLKYKSKYLKSLNNMSGGASSIPELVPGTYVSVDNRWMQLRVNQIEAFMDAQRKHSESMYGMGGMGDPNYGIQTAFSNDRSTHYSFMINLKTNNFYIQLGDKKYHLILVVPTGSFEFSKDDLKTQINAGSAP